MSAPKPRWRWWLFCVALDLWRRTGWAWTCRLYAWAVLPEWLGCEPGDTPAEGEEPF